MQSHESRSMELRIGSLARRLLLLLLLMNTVPINLVQCLNKKYGSTIARVKCSATKAFRPTSHEDISEIVLKAKKEGVTVRAVGGLFTPNHIICTEGYVVDMLGMDKIVVDEERMTVTAESGALLENMYKTLHKKGYALTTAGGRFSGSTVGGVLGICAFTSSLKHPALFDEILQMGIVDGRGSLLQISGSLLSATSINLGLMGIVVDATFPIVPRFQVVMKVSVKKEMYLLSQRLVRDALKHDIFKIAWYSSVKSVAVTTGTFQNKTSKDNDVANYGFQVNRYTADFVEDAEELSDLARKGNGTALCEFEAGNFRAQTSKTGNEKKCCGLKGYINDKGEFQNPARGWIHKMTSNSCPKGQCIWDYQGPRFLAVSRTVAIKLEDLPRAFMMIRKTIRERKLCSIASFGIQFAFLRKSDKYLALSYGHDAVTIQIDLPLRKDRREATDGHDAIQELIVKLKLQFNARPAWISAHPLSEPTLSVQQMYPMWPHFQAARGKLAGEGLFGNELYRVITDGIKPRKKKHCDVLGTCTCSEDVHCALDQSCKETIVNTTLFYVCKPL